MDASFPSKVRAIPSHRVILGDCLEALRAMESGSVDAVITDPPYSSGGLFRGDRMADVAKKYQQTGTEREYPTFSGDSRDQRSFGYWCALWLGQCRRISRPGAICGVFADWRQLPSMTDAMQAGGWIYRGIFVWHKPSARPIQGRFRSECEYLVWGTNGPRKLAGGCLPGMVSHNVKQGDKHHLTGKPTMLMRDLVQCCPPGGTVLDPFAGSGTTGVACKLEGRNFIGVELSPEYHAIAERRILEAKGAA